LAEQTDPGRQEKQVTLLRRSLAVLAVGCLALIASAAPAHAVSQITTYISVKNPSGTIGPIVLDVRDGSTANAAVVQLWVYGNSSQQKWNIIRLFKDGDAGYYTLKNVKSGKCLDESQARPIGNGNAVYQYDCRDTTNQVWVWVPAEAGNKWGFLVNLYSGKCLDATGASFNNGTPLQVWDCNYDNSSNGHQRFNVF
jgi:hypothetical protein